MRHPPRWWMLPVGGAIISVALALLLARQAGFPLDDAWIHQDFARTLATTGRFAFQPGRGGAGSTSPLWVLMLLPPQLVTQGHPPLWLLVAWVAALGVAALGGLGVVTGVAAADLARRAGASARETGLAALLAGLAVVCEWHLVWAALSGMETVLFALLCLALILAATRGVRPLWLGLLAAVAVATRPEGALVGALVGGGAAWSWCAPMARQAPRPIAAIATRLARWGREWLARFAAGALVGLFPYIALNIAASGHALPSTLYAKATYYGPTNVLTALAAYAAQIGVIMLASSPLLLALLALSYSRSLLLWWGRSASDAPKLERGSTPGLTAPSNVSSGDSGIRRHLTRLVPLFAGFAVPTDAPYQENPAAHGAAPFPLRAVLWLWPAALILGYAGHLTQLVHHGRYLMPALPPLLALAAAGAAPLLVDGRRLWSLAGGCVLTVTGLFSLVRGAQIYADNVHFINSCQVSTARWLASHTRPGALVATHDIGAIAYFSGRPVLDMAGLADPQVIPLLSNQAALETYLARRHAAYVVMFTDWFPPPAVLVRDLAGREVYRAPGMPTFVVYRTGW
jgi:hypothetical protein